MKAVVAAFNQENHLLVELFEALTNILSAHQVDLEILLRHYAKRALTPSRGLLRDYEPLDAIQMPLFEALVLTRHPLAGFGLQVNCILTFVIMFLPRSRQLTAMGKEGLYLEDHEDQVSLHRHDQEEMSYNQVQQQVFKVPGESPC